MLHQVVQSQRKRALEHKTIFLRVVCLQQSVFDSNSFVSPCATALETRLHICMPDLRGDLFDLEGVDPRREQHNDITYKLVFQKELDEVLDETEGWKVPKWRP